METISLILLSKELYETLPSESVCFALLLNFGKVFFPVAVLPATHTDVCNFGRSGESEILLKGSLKGLLKVLFELQLNFVFFFRDWHRISILEVDIQNWKLGAQEIVDEDDCVFGLYSACLILCALSKSLAMGSCSDSCIIDHPTGNELANLISLFCFFSFLAINVRLTDRSLTLSLDICCWYSYLIK